MKKDSTQGARVFYKEHITSQFNEWCVRHNVQIPDRPVELLNDETLTAAQRAYICSIIEFLD